MISTCPGSGASCGTQFGSLGGFVSHSSRMSASADPLLTRMGYSSPHSCLSHCSIYGSKVTKTEYDIESLTSEQQCEELIMLGSRTDSGINLDRLQSEFGYEITKIPDYYKKINNCIVPDGDLGFLFSDSALKTMLFNMDKSSYL